MNCPACNQKVEDNWNFCPNCSYNFKEIIDNFTDTDNYISFRDANFNEVRQTIPSLGGIGLIPIISSNSYRKKLGDFSSLNLFQLQTMGLIAYSPKLIEEVFKISRLVGYYMVYPTTQSTGLRHVISLIKSKEKNILDLPANKLIVEYMKKSWLKNKMGIIEEVRIEDDSLIYNINEVGCSIEALESQYCTLAANLCGIAEALTNQVWTGELIECGHICHKGCIIKIKPGDDRFVKEDLSQKKYMQTLKESVKNFAEGTNPYPRKTLGPDFHMSLHQILNYLMIKASPGHRILYKHCAVKTGELLGELKPTETFKKAIETLDKILAKNKAGRLEIKQEKQDRTILTLKESPHTTSLQNTQDKLDDYITSLTQGYLNKTQEKKYILKETKCTANKHNNCEIKIEKTT